MILILDNPIILNSLLSRFGLNPENISLEITERMKIEDLELAKQTLDKIYQLGVELKLDDAGTGYGGFSYVQELSISTLKIDKMFIEAIATDDVKHPVLDAIIAFAESSGLNMIAEGVEEMSQVEYLADREVFMIRICLAYAH